MYGDWRILNKIGSGGNGDVYRCKRTDGAEAAIKVLRRDRDRHRDRIVRFRNEVRFLISHGCRPGVVPLLDHALPDDPAGKPVPAHGEWAVDDFGLVKYPEHESATRHGRPRPSLSSRT